MLEETEGTSKSLQSLSGEQRSHTVLPSSLGLVTVHITSVPESLTEWMQARDPSFPFPFPF